jgi:hypothetical protein
LTNTVNSVHYHWYTASNCGINQRPFSHLCELPLELSLDLQGNFKHQVSKTTVWWKNVHFLQCLIQSWGGYLNLLLSAGSGYQNQITVSSCYFKSLKDLLVFNKELAVLGMTWSTLLGLHDV